MSAKTLFAIILKIIGILFIKDILLSIPQLLGFFAYAFSITEGISFGAMAMFVLSIGTYCLAAYWLVFRTEWLIDKLQLDAGFDVDPIRLNMHRSTILSICIIVIGALMAIHALPLLIKESIAFYQNSQTSRLFSAAPEPDKSFLIIYALQFIIGLLLVGNQRQVVNFIELRRRNNLQTEE